MKKHQNYITIFILLFLALTISACTKKGPADKDPSPADSEENIAMEDYWARPVEESENGYYYNVGSETSPLGIHYVDKASGKAIVLCTKPECRHDGNEFCVATNKKYTPFAFQLYGGALYMGAICIGEDKIEVKLVRIALDGSSLSEVATIFTSNLATNSDPTAYIAHDQMVLHRGKAFFQICVIGNDQMEDTISYGAAIYDMTEKTVSFFHAEDPISAENPLLENVSARGDYLYYIIKEDRKRVLHKYGLADGSDEPIELMTNFTGDYAVMNIGNIFYLRLGKKKLNVHYPDGTNKELGDFQYAAKLPLDEKSIPEVIKREWLTPEVYAFEYDSMAQSRISVNALLLLTDGETLFAQLNSPQRYSNQYYFTLPEEETELINYYLDPNHAIDPETGRWTLSVIDVESRLVSITLDYHLSDDHRVLMTFDQNGERTGILYPSVFSPAKDQTEYVYNFQPYVTREKIYYEITETQMDRWVNTRLLYVGESIEDLLSEKAFADPFLILMY